MTKIPNYHNQLPTLLPELSEVAKMLKRNGMRCILRPVPGHV